MGTLQEALLKRVDQQLCDSYKTTLRGLIEDSSPKVSHADVLYGMSFKAGHVPEECSALGEGLGA